MNGETSSLMSAPNHIYEDDNDDGKRWGRWRRGEAEVVFQPELHFSVK